MAVLNKQGKQLKAEIAAAAKTFPNYENLISIKGIGKTRTDVPLSTMVDIGNFAKSARLAIFFGMALGASQPNGSMRFAHTARRGSKIVRTTLVQCSLFATFLKICKIS